MFILSELLLIKAYFAHSSLIDKLHRTATFVREIQ